MTARERLEEKQRMLNKAFKTANADAQERTAKVKGTLALKALFITVSRTSNKRLQISSPSEAVEHISEFIFHGELSDNAKQEWGSYAKTAEVNLPELINICGLTDADESDYLTIKFELSDTVWNRVIKAYRYFTGREEVYYDTIINSIVKMYVGCNIKLLCDLSKRTTSTKYFNLHTSVAKRAESLMRSELGVSQFDDVLSDEADLTVFHHISTGEQVYTLYDLVRESVNTGFVAAIDEDTFYGLTFSEQLETIYALAVKMRREKLNNENKEV